MSKKIKITIRGEGFTALLNDSVSADLLYRKLPLQVSMSRWGEEYYGECGVVTDIEKEAREIMEVGEIAIWPDGNALCIFFGPTPVSTDEKPKAIAPVNPIGKIEDDVTILKGFPNMIQAEIETV